MKPLVTPISLYAQQNAQNSVQNAQNAQTDKIKKPTNPFNRTHPSVENFDHSQAPSDYINCLTAFNHIEKCPICSKLYDTDKTLYVLAIIGLTVLCWYLVIKHIMK